MWEHAEDDARLGLETGSMTPWLVHELRGRALDVTCLDARHARAALKMQINKTDQNDAEGLAQIMHTGWYRSVHVKSLDAHRARTLLGARAQLAGQLQQDRANVEQVAGQDGRGVHGGGMGLLGKEGRRLNHGRG